MKLSIFLLGMLVAIVFNVVNFADAANRSEISSSTSSERGYAPAPYVEGGRRFVPVDISKNDVHWKIGDDLSKITAVADLSFSVFESGFPVLILNTNTKAFIDGKEVALEKLSQEPFRESGYFSLNEYSVPGKTYNVQLKYSFAYDRKDMKNFLPIAYYDHKTAEMGIPSNALFDRFPVTLSLEIQGNKDFTVLANGLVSRGRGNTYQIKFPETFNSVAFFVDIVAKDELVEVTKSLVSMDGRKIQAKIYSTVDEESAKKWISTFAGIVEYKFAELERLFGPYPQETLIVKLSNKKTGGGAYAGAMVLFDDYMEDMSHEMGHSWFLHSVTPASGEDTWIFEGFGNWAHLYRTGFALDQNLEDAIVLGTGDYKIWATPQMFPQTHLRQPHQTGSMVLASIDQFLKSSGKQELSGGLVPVLKIIAQERKHQTMSTKDFQLLLEKHSGLDFSELFNFYTKDIR